MNIAPHAENEGRLHAVRGAPSVSGIHVRSQRPNIARAAANVVDDDDDDFAALMNPAKQLEPQREEVGVSRSGSVNAAFADNISEMSYDRENSRDDSFFRADDPRDGIHSEKKEGREFRSLEEEKQYYLGKISSFNSRGIPSHRHVSIETPIDELKHEFERLRRQSTMVSSVKFQRRILMAIVTGAEFVNKKFNPLNLKLDGWSESMMDSIEEYDGVFEQLHDKYSGTAEVAPEWQLMMMVLGSGFMFHLSNTLFRSVLPNVTDIAKQNPELMQNIANAMSGAMGKSGVEGSSTSELGLGLVQQAAQNMMQPPATVPVQPMPDPASLTPPVSTRAIEEVSSDAGSSEVSGVSGLSDLRNVSAGSSRKRRKQGPLGGRAVEINL